MRPDGIHNELGLQLEFAFSKVCPITFWFNSYLRRMTQSKVCAKSLPWCRTKTALLATPACPTLAASSASTAEMTLPHWYAVSKEALIQSSYDFMEYFLFPCFHGRETGIVFQQSHCSGRSSEVQQRAGKEECIIRGADVFISVGILFSPKFEEARGSTCSAVASCGSRAQIRSSKFRVTVYNKQIHRQKRRAER